MRLNPLIQKNLADFSKENPEMSMAEVLYSLLRHAPKPEGVNVAWMLEISDDELLNISEGLIDTDSVQEEEPDEWEFETVDDFLKK